MRVLRVYADTSVFGGVFDEEFAFPSRAFFDQVREGRFQLISSALVVDELADAPDPVRAHFLGLSNLVQLSDISNEAIDLRDAYLTAGIVGPSSRDDAQTRGVGDHTRMLDHRELELQAHSTRTQDFVV